VGPIPNTWGDRPVTPSPLAGGQPTAAYQRWMVVLLSLNIGIVFFDRFALNFLMPFVQTDLHLNNTQVGAFSSALSLSWALSCLLIGRVSDAWGRRKPLLVFCTVVFACMSFLSGVAGSFVHTVADPAADGCCRRRCHPDQPCGDRIHRGAESAWRRHGCNSKLRLQPTGRLSESSLVGCASQPLRVAQRLLRGRGTWLGECCSNNGVAQGNTYHRQPDSPSRHPRPTRKPHTCGSAPSCPRCSWRSS